ncbi:MAG: peptidoglycan DD-metalloendopeptidase family protein [Rhodospirillaceae bacterium]|nr:peptidoglycan DD-metalloendopeptidase family protein [Rhodospirillaceae bacterium]
MRLTLAVYVYVTLVAGVAAAATDLTTAEPEDTVAAPIAAPVPVPVAEAADAPAAEGPRLAQADTDEATEAAAPVAPPVAEAVDAIDPDTASDVPVAASGEEDAEDSAAPLASVLALSVADSLLTEPYAIGTERRSVTVASGNTLLGILGDAGAPRAEAHALIAALEEYYDPRDLQIGQELTLILEHTGQDTTLVGLEIMPDVEATIQVTRQDDASYVAEPIATTLEERPVAASGEISSSLAADTGAAGVPYSVLVPLVRAYSYTVDFQRDIQPGDLFEILFQRAYFEDGTVARDDEVSYARLQLGDRDLPVYLFEASDGFIDYFDRDGLSVRRALLRTPIDGARLSSGFGYRRHPILGYTRMHRGVDFAAPTGTPVFAAGDGVVEMAGPYAGYGNYVRIRHNGQLGTAYGHLSRFARGLTAGARVRQGEVIAYVGSTGLSTGPHLHYEVLVNGTQVNPLSVDLPTGRQLTGDDMVAFRERVDEVDALFRATLRAQGQFAETPQETDEDGGSSAQ